MHIGKYLKLFRYFSFKIKKSDSKLVQPPGFEPGTPTFVVLYSIQLNYGCT